MSRRTIAIVAALIVSGTIWLFLYQTTTAQIERGGPAPTRTPDRGPSPTPVPGATPTIDRLLAPPTVPAPNQADEGAQLYWLHCQPCHGDQGQGLTDEWRMQYPPEEQYCWESGCHGNRPYNQHVALPTSVPALIGPAVDRIMSTQGTQVLTRFQTLDGVYRYVSVAMPLFFPGDLTQEEYLAILAYIARENGIWDGVSLTTDRLINYPLHPTAIEVDPISPISTPTSPAPLVPEAGQSRTEILILGVAAVFVVALAAGILWLRYGR